MCHFNRSDVEGYLQATITEEFQAEMEQHLEGCSHCFETYMELLEAQTFGDISLSESFTEDVIGQLDDRNMIPEKSHSPLHQPKKNKVVAHYFLAAGLTIVLMLTGVFQNFLAVTNNFENKPSFTEHLMQKTSVVLDDMKGDFKK